MDHYLKGVDNGVGKEKPVRIFVMGDNVWRDEDAWPLARAKETTLFLSPETWHETGTMDLAPARCVKCARYAEFVSDPQRPVTDPYAEFGARDYHSFAGRQDV